VTTRRALVIVALVASGGGLLAGARAPTIQTSDPGVSRSNGVVVYAGVAFTGTLTEIADGVRTKKTTPYRSGLRHGISRAWHANGALAFAGSFLSGRETGLHRTWYATGQLRSEHRLERGLLQGVARDWFPDGTPYRAATYVDGQEAGSQQMWYTDGSLRANYVVRDGRRFGLIGAKACVDEAEVLP
jgi:antitoxin component YwqK of YwqJK toxin-antitoxin module